MQERLFCGLGVAILVGLVNTLVVAADSIVINDHKYENVHIQRPGLRTYLVRVPETGEYIIVRKDQVDPGQIEIHPDEEYRRHLLEQWRNTRDVNRPNVRSVHREVSSADHDSDMQGSSEHSQHTPIEIRRPNDDEEALKERRKHLLNVRFTFRRYQQRQIEARQEWEQQQQIRAQRHLEQQQLGWLYPRLLRSDEAGLPTIDQSRQNAPSLPVYDSPRPLYGLPPSNEIEILNDAKEDAYTEEGGATRVDVDTEREASKQEVREDSENSGVAEEMEPFSMRAYRSSENDLDTGNNTDKDSNEGLLGKLGSKITEIFVSVINTIKALFLLSILAIGFIFLLIAPNIVVTAIRRW